MTNTVLKIRLLMILSVYHVFFIKALAQEKIFAGYFDIQTNSTSGVEVNGGIHLERNKDVLVFPIPKSYQYKILQQDDHLFNIETRFDLSNRIIGVLTVNKGMATGSVEKSYNLTVALTDGNKLLNKFPVIIKIVNKTLWYTLFERYKDYTVSSLGNRMYGRTKFTDQEVEQKIIELEQNKGRFLHIDCYTKHPQEYVKNSTRDELNGSLLGTIEVEWEKVANQIGGLGYSYAKSLKYGPKGKSNDRERLKNAIYSSILAYTACVPIEGSDIMIAGKPIGNCTGDGFSKLKNYNMMGMQVATHQWVVSDPIVAPAVHIMPDLLADIKKGNETAKQVHNALIRFFQLTMAEIDKRRAIDNPDERWCEIRDTLNSEGAWADANLGHRLRVLLALPIVWADYNRPLTYVQYWYSDFYKDKPFPGFSFSPGWSPHGVVFDVNRWLKKFNIPAHQYAQSGFHPDGTVSHHTDHGTDAAMVAYGFGWLTEPIIGFNQFKNTDFRLENRYYQFPADRLLNVYPKLIYKGSVDFLVAGRSYLGDLKQFVERDYLSAINDLLAAKSNDSYIKNENKLLKTAELIKDGKYEYSGTNAYWVNEYLVHRRGENENPFYASVKLKSERTVGAEDFDRVRKSWFAASGVLTLKVRGDEYSQQVLKNMDFHMLPGITEEWRTDPLPAKGGSQAALPGKNKIASVLSDGEIGMAMYHHLPQETYSSATALKSYHFIGNKIVALGSKIKRCWAGQQQAIFTCIDQSSFKNELVYSIDKVTRKIEPNESVNISEDIKNKVCWIHTGEKGYVFIPTKTDKLVIKTGKQINITDKKIADNNPNFIISLNHGINPETSKTENYCYVLVPNVSLTEMPEVAKQLFDELHFNTENDSIHTLFSDKDKVYQATFFKSGEVKMGSIALRSENVSMISLKFRGDSCIIAVSNPLADANIRQLKFELSTPLLAGKYSYSLPGIYPITGEYVTVERTGLTSKMIIKLPDINDKMLYNHQARLYASAPIVVSIPIEKSK